LSITARNWKSVTALAGFVHGFSVHSKLYPVIYTLGYMCYFGRAHSKNNNGGLIRKTIQNVLTPPSILFAITTTIGFVLPTYLSWVMYPSSLHNSLIYHFTRVDHRHNYSMFWYGIYLSGGDSSGSELATVFTALCRVLFIPQVVLLAILSVTICPVDLTFGMFLQTFVFVAFNKVITGQYFTWYLCLLPLCGERVGWRGGRMRRGIGVLGGGFGLWLLGAYLLEMRGWEVYRGVFAGSVVFFASNIYFIVGVLKSYTGVEVGVGVENGGFRKERGGTNRGINKGKKRA